MAAFNVKEALVAPKADKTLAQCTEIRRPCEPDFTLEGAVVGSGHGCF